MPTSGHLRRCAVVRWGGVPPPTRPPRDRRPPACLARRLWRNDTAGRPTRPAHRRRASGPAFAANANVASAEHRFVSGAEALVEYESSPGKLRAFCGRCGSPIYSRTTAEPDTLRIRLGTVDQDPGGRPRLHVWTSEQAAWYAIDDDLPRIPSIPRQKGCPINTHDA